MLLLLLALSKLASILGKRQAVTFVQDGGAYQNMGRSAKPKFHLPHYQFMCEQCTPTSRRGFMRHLEKLKIIEQRCGARNIETKASPGLRGRDSSWSPYFRVGY
jgi:hypothetical protein